MWPPFPPVHMSPILIVPYNVSSKAPEVEAGERMGGREVYPLVMASLVQQGLGTSAPKEPQSV